MEVIKFERSVDQLENALIDCANERNAMEYRFLELVREFEIRQVYRQWMLNNTAEWLNMKCGISLGTAREKVRVAMALFDKPLWSKAFREGKLPYSKARAMTRLPDEDEAALLDFALSRRVSDVESHCRQLRNANRTVSTEDANRAHRARWTSCSQDPDGIVHLRADLPAETGMLVMKALEVAARSLADDTGEDAESGTEGFFAKQADALVEIARSYLSGECAGKSQHDDNYTILVHVDASALKGDGGRSDLPFETVQRLACSSGIVEVTEDPNGGPLDAGRKKRIVSTAQRRALIARDKHCRFPGCSHTKWLQPHHVVFFSEGGETTVANHLMLCSRHHRLVHEGGYTIHRNHEGKWFFKTAHGKIVADERLYDDATDDPSCDASVHEPDTDPSRDGFVEEGPPPLYAVGG